MLTKPAIFNMSRLATGNTAFSALSGLMTRPYRIALSLIKPTITKYYTKSQSLRKKHVIPLDDVRRRNRPVKSALKAAETETPHAIVIKIEDTESLLMIMQSSEIGRKPTTSS